MRSFVLNRSYMSPNDSYQSFLNTTEFRAAMTPFDPKDYLVAEASLRDIEIFKQIFDFFDLHNQGVLTPMDLRRAFLMFNYKAQKPYIYQMISEFDGDESGAIEFAEFVRMMVLNPCESDTEQDIRRVFDQIDRERKGYITTEDIKIVQEDMREEELDENSLTKMVRILDPQDTGKIKWEAFLKFNMKKNFVPQQKNKKKK